MGTAGLEPAISRVCGRTVHAAMSLSARRGAVPSMTPDITDLHSHTLATATSAVGRRRMPMRSSAARAETDAAAAGPRTYFSVVRVVQAAWWSGNSSAFPIARTCRLGR
jgi:hypothetical protein